MSEYFSEKAHFKHKEKCKHFVEIHINDKNNHAIGSKALKLSHKLMMSMIRSQRFFDKRVKYELDSINSLESDIAKEIAIIRFNKKQIVLILDADAHKVFDGLKIIIDNNLNV